MSNLAGLGSRIVINDILPRVLRDITNLPTAATKEIQEKVSDVASVELPPATRPKSGVQSVTVWAGVGTILTSLATGWIAYQSGDMGAVYTSVTTAFTGIMAIYGRYRATQTVGSA